MALTSCVNCGVEELLVLKVCIVDDFESWNHFVGFVFVADSDSACISVETTQGIPEFLAVTGYSWIILLLLRNDTKRSA